MALAFVDTTATTTTSVTNPSITLDFSPAQDSLIVAIFRPGSTDANVTAGPTGYTKENTVSRATSITLQTWSKIAGAGESTTLTWTLSVAQVAQICVLNFTGSELASYRDVNPTLDNGTGLVTSLGLATGTLAQANEVIVSAASTSGGNGGSEAIDSSFNIVETAALGAVTVGYKIVSSTAGETPTHSWLTARAAIIANTSYLEAAAGAATNVNHMALMGVG